MLLLCDAWDFKGALQLQVTSWRRLVFKVQMKTIASPASGAYFSLLYLEPIKLSGLKP